MKERTFSIILTFFIAFILWLIFSAWNIYLVGYYDPFRLVRGLIVASIVALFMHELVIARKVENLSTKLYRFLIYCFWEFYQIILAAIDVSLRVLGYRDVNPQLIEFETHLRSDEALTTLGNSITLTPGTITIDVDPETGRFLVHAIAIEPALSLLEEYTVTRSTVEDVVFWEPKRIPAMIRKVSHVFMEEEGE